MTETKIHRCNKVSETPEDGLGCVFFSMSVSGFEIQISLVELEVKLTRKDFLLSFKLDFSPQKRKKKCAHHERGFRGVCCGNTCGE